MSNEFQVSLSLAVEAKNIHDAIEEFKWDVANGPDYVYAVDTGDALYSYDTENGVRTETPRIDKGTLDAAIDALVTAVHDYHSEDYPYPVHFENIETAKLGLYKLFGLV